MSTTQHTPGQLYIKYGAGAIAVYTKPIHEAKAADRLFRLPRNPITEKQVQAMVAAPKLLTALQRLEESVRFAPVGIATIQAAAEARLAIAEGTGQA